MRVFTILTPNGSTRVFGARVRDRSVDVWEGVPSWILYDPKKTTTYASSEAATVAFAKLCAGRLSRGWKEIKDREPWLPYVLKEGLKPSKPVRAPKPTIARAETLLRIVAARGAIRVRRKNAALSKVTLKSKLVLPTGRLVAVDALHLDDDARPFTRALPRGSYDVELAMAQGRVAAASIVVRKKAPVRWELALPKGMLSLVAPRFRDVRVPPSYGVPVDAANLAFVDEAGLDVLLEEDVYRLRVVPSRGRVQSLGKAGSAAVVSTGFGDGSYGVYFGMVGDEIVRVTADFAIDDEPS